MTIKKLSMSAAVFSAVVLLAGCQTTKPASPQEAWLVSLVEKHCAGPMAVMRRENYRNEAEIYTAAPPDQDGWLKAKVYQNRLGLDVYANVRTSELACSTGEWNQGQASGKHFVASIPPFGK